MLCSPQNFAMSLDVVYMCFGDTFHAEYDLTDGLDQSCDVIEYLIGYDMALSELAFVLGADCHVHCLLDMHYYSEIVIC